MFTYEGSNRALRGFMDAIGTSLVGLTSRWLTGNVPVIVISTPFLIYAIIAVILNLLLPSDPDTLIISKAQAVDDTAQSDLEAQALYGSMADDKEKRHR
jgi:hypothetical protein